MSRRKQSNPKPIKRDSEDEIEHLSRSHNLPVDILRLKPCTESSNGYTVYSTIPIPQGSSFGPFKGCLVTDEEHEYSHTLEFPVNEEQSKKIIALTEEGEIGGWIKLIKTTSDKTASNVQICVQDNSTVWCEIIQNISEDMELLATLSEDRASEREGNNNESPAVDSRYLSAPHNNIEERIMEDNNNTEKAKTPSPSPPTLPASPAKSTMYPLIFGCVNCGIKFSSPDTLQAHTTYYCNKRHLEAEKETTNSSELEDKSTGNKTELDRKEKICLPAKKRPYTATSPSASSVSSDEEVDVTNDHSSGHSSPVSAAEGSTVKSLKTGQLYECPDCSYTTDKKNGLNRHMRIHDVHLSKYGHSTSLDDVKEAIPQADLFCHECNIQFKSYKTFRGHKEFYCQMRHKKSMSESSLVTPRSPDSPTNMQLVQPQISPIIPAVVSQSAAALVQNLLPPLNSSHLLAPGGAVQPGSAVVLAAPILTQNGLSNMTFNVPTVIMQPVIVPANNISAHSNRPFLPASKQTTPTSDEQPLDLSVPKDRESSDREKPAETSTCPVKKREVSSVQPPPLNSDRSSQHVIVDRATTSVKPKETMSMFNLTLNGSSHVPVSLASVQQSPLVSSELSILMKQTQPSGSPVTQTLPTSSSHFLPTPTISKCLDCNIVFYKYENYAIHKRHYCSGRQRKSLDVESMLSTQRDDEVEDKVSESKPEIKSHDPGLFRAVSMPHIYHEPKEKNYLQYYCDPCKIKFSSWDTLIAHKQYYCPSREMIGGAPMVQRDSISEEASPPSSPEASDAVEHVCKYCDNSYPSARLLKLHYCKATTLKTCYVRCPYCEYIAQTDNRLIEHIKAHAPSKAYKCTLCGYRGNTIRGMRMHGKMHIDAGENFTDDNMMEFDEPPLIPKRFRTATECDRGLDIEAELIRLKNEPYKRRRSRKSYEKVENIVQTKSSASGIAEENGASSLHESVSLDIKNQEKTAASSSSTRPHRIAIEHRSHLVVDHNTEESDNISKPAQNGDSELNINHTSHAEAQDGIHSELIKQTARALFSVKKEHTELGYKDTTKDNVSVAVDADTKYHNPVVKDIKIEVSENGAICEENTVTPKTSGVIRMAVSPHSKSSPSLEGTSSPPRIGNVSQEGNAANSLDTKLDKCKAKLCKQCGISFTYLSTFIAHKKYYCNSHALERSAASPTTV